MPGFDSITEAAISALPNICPCCNPQLTPCCDCVPGTYRNWFLRVQGFTNGSCLRCEEYNGIFILFEFPSLGSCFWISNLPDSGGIGNPCGGSFSTWQMSCTQIIANGIVGAAIARYALVGTFQCNTQNTFALVEQDGSCNNLPSQLLVNPIFAQ